MKQRIITAIIVLIIGIPVLWIGSTPFIMAILTLSLIAFFEIMQMANIRLKSPESLLGAIATVGLALPETSYDSLRISPLLLLSVCAFTMLIITVFSENKFSYEKVAVVCLSALYIGLGGHYVIAIRSHGFIAMIFVLAIGWATDTGAYFVGRSFGRRKLAPHISPNKSVEGAISGILIAILFSIVYYTVYQPFSVNLIGLIFLTIGVSICGQLGDLVESALKRFYNVKDSGSILPGHGGVLDRFDSTLFGVIACHIILLWLT